MNRLTMNATIQRHDGTWDNLPPRELTPHMTLKDYVAYNAMCGCAFQCIEVVNAEGEVVEYHEVGKEAQ